MSCPVDPEKWAEQNRVELYPGKVNRWVLVRTLRDNPTPETLRDTTRAVMGKWFRDSGVGVMTAEASDAVDSISIESCSYSRPTPRKTDQRRESTQPVPLMAPSEHGYVYLTVDFNYRGAQRSMPWPVWSQAFSLLRSSKICPIGADWMLAQASAPTAEQPLPEAPPEQSWWEKVDQYGSHTPLGDVQNLVRLAGVALAIYVGVQAYGLARPMLAARARSKDLP